MTPSRGNPTEGVTLSVPGKLILSGEHAVVYGQPAIVAAVDRVLTLRARWGEVPTKSLQAWVGDFGQIGAVELLQRLRSIAGVTIELNSTIPIGSGMGSSAALAAGLSALVIKMLGEPANREKINALAFELEKFAHGRPSGADNTIVTHGGLLRFQRDPLGRPQFSPLPIPKKWPAMFAVQTGQPDETTGEMVQSVRQLIESQPEKAKIIAAIGLVTESFQTWIAGDNKVSRLVEIWQANEGWLEKLGVVSPSTVSLVRSIEKLGGAAKISGAGGRKNNSGIILCVHPDPEKLASFLRRRRCDFFPVIINPNGIKESA